MSMQDAIAVYLANKGLASGATKDEMCRDLDLRIQTTNVLLSTLKKTGVIDYVQDGDDTVYNITQKGLSKYQSKVIQSKDEQMIEQFKPVEIIKDNQETPKELKWTHEPPQVDFDKGLDVKMMQAHKEIEEEIKQSPAHYKQGSIECIDALKELMPESQYIGFLRGNVMKYIWRYENKGGRLDLEKARDYLNWLIEAV